MRTKLISKPLANPEGGNEGLGLSFMTKSKYLTIQWSGNPFQWTHRINFKFTHTKQGYKSKYCIFWKEF